MGENNNAKPISCALPQFTELLPVIKYKAMPMPKIAPIRIRALLTFCCALVSFAHGSNDGQKGIGLMMLVLIAFVPKSFVINPDVNLNDITTSVASAQHYINLADTNRLATKPDLCPADDPPGPSCFCGSSLRYDEGQLT